MPQVLSGMGALELQVWLAQVLFESFVSVSFGFVYTPRRKLR